MSQQEDDAKRLLDKSLSAYVATRRRYPLLAAIVKAIELALNTTTGALHRQDLDPVVLNDAIFQVVLDCFDMLVIDLASVRKLLVGRDGLLSRLKSEPSLLRKCSFSKIPTRHVQVCGDGKDHARVARETDEDRREKAAQSINSALSRLIPDEYPVTSVGVDTLIKRFIKDTSDTHEDRNRVRAHRHEYGKPDQERYAQSLENVQEQLKVFERYLEDLFLVLTHSSISLTQPFRSDVQSAASDLAAILVHGSINEAVNGHRVAQVTEDNPNP